jgi:predicted permease
MKLLRRLLARFLASSFNPAKRRRDEERLREEIEEHLALEAAENLRAGMTPAEARRQAILNFGAVEAIKETYRAERGLPFVETLLQDLRFALRMLFKNRGFAVIAILTLAIGIGANTTIFSVINAVMLRPLQVEDSQHLLVFSWSALQRPKYRGHSSYGDCDERIVKCDLSFPLFQAMREQAKSFSSVAAYAGPLGFDFSGNGPASIANGEFVSGNYFSTVGLKTVLGRPLAPTDDSPSAPPAIVLTYGYWQRAFGADPAAIGRAVRLNNTDAIIVGVADPRFIDLTPGKADDFLMPFSLSDRVRSEWWGHDNRLTNAATWWIILVGRLKPGVSMSQADAEATTIFRDALVHGPVPMSKESDQPAIKLLPAREALTSETGEIARMLNLVMAAVGFVLLIACANVAGLMLARSAGRQKEMAVRQALGAGSGRIARQLLTESVLLSAAGGALGILIAAWGTGVVARLMASGSGKQFPFAISPDWRVLAFTMGITLVTGILAGLAPALRGTRLDLAPSLRENASSLHGSAPRTGQRLRLSDALVIAQVALSIVVLIGAGLLVRTLGNLRHLDPGFDTENVLLLGINPAIAGYNDRQSAQLYRTLQERFEALPGVIWASYSEDALVSRSWSADDVHLDGALPKSNVSAETLTVGLHFFSAMRISLLAGRSFSPADFASAADTRDAIKASDEAEREQTATQGTAKFAQSQPAPVPVIVNQSFARMFFPGQNPVGRHMGNAEEDDPPKGPQPGYRIVGVVGDTKYRDMRHDVEPMMFLPLVGNSAHFELRTNGDPDALVNAVRGIVADADSRLPLFDVRTQTDQIEQTLYQERLMSRLFGFFALLALVLACIGLFGLLSYEVARRTRELGIRMALGAQKRDLLRLVVGQGFLLVCAGVTLGVGAAIGVTRFMASMLYNVGPADPATYTAVASLLAVVALAACCIPALRAMRVDPMVALRDE